jgi:cytochrome bd ubiquinol oxidase subunit II
MTLNIIWFLLVGILIIVYAILDGFDLGVGVLHLFTKNENEKRIYLNSIGPVWDGNEVWLIAAGGAIFAAFPYVYATVFSGFYIAIYLLLLALVFRAISFEFRSKVNSPIWKKFWDWSFGLGSLLPVVLLGVALGNILRGVPIDAMKNFTGNFLTLLNPYSILIGILSLVMMTMHGSIYLTFKTEGELRERNINYARKLWLAFIIFYVISTLTTVFVSPFLFKGVLINPIWWILIIVFLITVIGIPLTLKKNNFKYTFIFSSFLIASVIGFAAVGLYPNLVPSSISPDFNLTIVNASSTQRTLTAMLIIALIGMPFVAVYTIIMYRVFKGKPIITDESY